MCHVALCSVLCASWLQCGLLPLLLLLRAAAGKHCLSVCMQGLRAAGGLVPGGLLLLLLRRATAPVAPWRAYGEMRKAKAQLRLVMAMA